MCCGATVTMPVDVVKTRLQMDGAGGVKLYSGTLDCATKMVRAEGPGALFKGLPPALVRQSTYGSLRYGLYGPIRNSLGVHAATLQLQRSPSPTPCLAYLLRRRRTGHAGQYDPSLEKDRGWVQPRPRQAIIP